VVYTVDVYGEDIDINNNVNEDSFEVDTKYNALIIKSGCMSDRRNCGRYCWWKCRS
jgi:hypothetical protein